MKKALIAGIGVFSAALVAVAASFSSSLDGFVAKLSKADGLQASYTVTVVGGDASKVDIALAKPNKARIETANQLVVADGEKITTYDKKENSYFTAPQTGQDFRALFADQATSTWLPFFDEKAFAKLVTKDAGTKTRRGMTLNVVNAAYPDTADMSSVFYVDQADGLAKQAEFTSKTSAGTVTTVMNVGSVKLAASPADLFAFSAPAGAKEMKMEDMSLGKWLTDIDQAFKIATKAKKLMVVDFGAVW